MPEKAEQLPKSKVFWKNTIRRWADGDFCKNPQGLTLLFGGCGDYLAIRFANFLVGSWKFGVRRRGDFRFQIWDFRFGIYGVGGVFTIQG